MYLRNTSVRTGCCLHTQQSGRGHLSSRHTINGIVDEDNCNIFTAVECMDRFSSTDTSQVTISLVSEYQSVRPQSFYGRGQSWSTSVCCFLAVNIQIVIHKYGTSYRADADSFFFHAHFFNDFSNQLMYDSMATSRAIMHRIVIEQAWLLVY